MKLLKKQQKKQIKVQKRQEYIIQKQERLEQKRRKKLEELQTKKETQEKLLLEKSKACREYIERHERKRLKELKQQSQKQEVPLIPKFVPSDDDRKLFIGGLTFEDLNQNVKRKKLDEKMVPKCKGERVKNFPKLLERFGKISSFKDFILEKRHCFVSYERPNDLEKALESLSDFEQRKKICTEMKIRLQQEGGDIARFFAPNPHFYVRVVKAAKELEKKKKIEKMKEEKVEKGKQKQIEKIQTKIEELKKLREEREQGKLVYKSSNQKEKNSTDQYSQELDEQSLKKQLDDLFGIKPMEIPLDNVKIPIPSKKSKKSNSFKENKKVQTKTTTVQSFSNMFSVLDFEDK